MSCPPSAASAPWSGGFIRSASATGDFAVDSGEMTTPRTRGKAPAVRVRFAFGRRIRVQRECPFGDGREGERQWTRPVSSLRYGMQWYRGSQESRDWSMRRSLAITCIEFDRMPPSRWRRGLASTAGLTAFGRTSSTRNGGLHAKRAKPGCRRGAPNIQPERVKMRERSFLDREAHPADGRGGLPAAEREIAISRQAGRSRAAEVTEGQLPWCR